MNQRGNSGEPHNGGLWAPAHRRLTSGLVLTTTFIAVEALAVITIMPQVEHDLRGLSLYGWVFSSFMLGSLVGITIIEARFRPAAQPSPQAGRP